MSQGSMQSQSVRDKRILTTDRPTCTGSQLLVDRLSDTFMPVRAENTTKTETELIDCRRWMRIVASKWTLKNVVGVVELWLEAKSSRVANFANDVQMCQSGVSRPCDDVG